jgi:hypothetical protein
VTFETIRVTGLSDDEEALANLLLDRLDKRSDRNRLRLSYYDGKRAARQISKIVPPQYHRLGLILGWSAKAVDALGRRCVIDDFTWPDGDLGSLGVSGFAEDNMLLSELAAGRSKAFIHGVSFLVNTVGVEGEPSSLLHVKDALNATGEWNARTRRLDNLLSVTARHDNKPTAFTLYLDGVTITVEKDAGWVVTSRQEHRYGVPAEPLIYRPHGREFGYSRISRPIMGLQDAAVRTLIRLEGHMDIYSYPELLLLGADGSVFKDDAGNTLPVWQAMMGRIKGIPDDKDAPSDALARADVRQFAASSPEPHLKQLNALAKLFAREASLPDSATAIADMANPTSAESYDSSQYELIAEAEGAVDDFTRPIARAIRRGLAIRNGVAEMPDSWASIAPKWRNPRYVSKAAQADAGAKQLAALPWLAETEVGLELLGLTSDQARRALVERRRSAGRATIAALAGVAQADVTGS